MILAQGRKRLVARLAANYVAGPVAADALSACRRAAQRGGTATIGYWNRPEDSPGEVAAACSAVLRAIESERLPCSLSLKLPALHGRVDLFEKLVCEAAQRSVRLHFDALGLETADLCFDAVERARQVHPAVGITLPSRWRRSLDDAARALELGVAVRVVKGQWPDRGWPAADPIGRFLQIVAALAGRARHVAVATHDAVLASEAIAPLRASGTPFTLEQLWGLPLVTRSSGLRHVPVCWYVPFGEPCLPYRLREAGSRPAVIGWAFRDLLGKRNPLG